jgi:enoyl-CoA hydratase/carnithine racemase
MPIADVNQDSRAQGDPGGLMACHLDGPVAVVTMNHRPYNLMGRAFTEQLIDGLRWVGESGARAAILRSGLRHFSAGADLDGMLEAAGHGDGTLDWPILEMLRAFDELPMPIVAAVHGNCLGGGLEMALACDLIIASESAKIGSVEATVGLHPLAGGIQRLSQRTGAARAKEMALLARRYDARTMERWNVINRVVADEQLDRAAVTLARELAGGPTIAHAATKALVTIAINEGVGAADEAMTELQKPIFASGDFRTGVASLKQNGPGMASFKGR